MITASEARERVSETNAKRADEMRKTVARFIDDVVAPIVEEAAEDGLDSIELRCEDLSSDAADEVMDALRELGYKGRSGIFTSGVPYIELSW